MKLKTVPLLMIGLLVTAVTNVRADSPKLIQESNLDFVIHPAQSMDEIHYSAQVMSPAEFSKIDFPHFGDPTSFSSSDQTLIVSKSAILVRRDEKFFASDQSLDPGYLSKALDAAVRKDGGNFDVEKRISLIFKDKFTSTYKIENQRNFDQDVLKTVTQYDAEIGMANDFVIQDASGFNMIFTDVRSLIRYQAVTDGTLIIDYQIMSVKNSAIAKLSSLTSMLKDQLAKQFVRTKVVAESWNN